MENISHKSTDLKPIKLHNGQIEIAHADCFKYIKTLADNSIDLVLIDPPYYKVKSDSWDNQWDNVTHYLAWLDDLFYEIWRVLKPNGSFYCFCSPRLSAETEMLIKQRFNVLNHIVWSKTEGRHKAASKESLRSYFSSSELIIFAEHYGAEGKHKGQVGYAVKCQELKKELLKPLADYFINAKKELGITSKEINDITGTQMSNHWFGRSQWSIPSEANYKKLHAYFDKIAKNKGVLNPLKKPFNNLLKEGQSFKKEYENLTKKYNALKQQYNNMRRHFSVTADVPYTDVWTIKPVRFYEGKHPCEKPKELLQHIISASSREGHVVADFFMGSGSTAIACAELGRKFVGCEMDNVYFYNIKNKLNKSG